MTSGHSRWVRTEASADDPERIAIREALAFGKAVYDRRTALGLSVPDLAMRARVTVDDIECIEEGGAGPNADLLGRLVTALDWDVHAASMRTRLARLAADVAALPVADTRPPEEIIGYDETGLPRS
jgi:transcriptional regulator with XRE-family HTH domain